MEIIIQFLKIYFNILWTFLGEGQFGKVYSAVNMDTGELMAMKEVDLCYYSCVWNSHLLKSFLPTAICFTYRQPQFPYTPYVPWAIWLAKSRFH